MDNYYFLPMPGFPNVPLNATGRAPLRVTPTPAINVAGAGFKPNGAPNFEPMPTGKGMSQNGLFVVNMATGKTVEEGK